MLVPNSRENTLNDIQRKKLQKYIWLVNNNIDIIIKTTISGSPSVIDYGHTYNAKSLPIVLANGFQKINKKPHGYDYDLDKTDIVAYQIMEDIYGSNNLVSDGLQDVNFSFSVGNNTDNFKAFCVKNNIAVIIYSGGGKIGASIIPKMVFNWGDGTTNRPIIPILKQPHVYIYISNFTDMGLPETPYYYIKDIAVDGYGDVHIGPNRTKFCNDSTLAHLHPYICDGHCPNVDIGTVGPTPCDSGHTPPSLPVSSSTTYKLDKGKPKLHVPCCHVDQAGGIIYMELRIPKTSPYYRK